jgi:dTDP-4-amino-4,6-dideoxygalactose transaminase
MNIESKFGIPTQIAQEFGISKNYSKKSIDLNLDEKGRVGFIENKHYDFQRLSDLLELSTSSNHHANGGPVSKLLETVVQALIQPDFTSKRSVIATCNGTAALQLACGVHEILDNRNKYRWVTSNFNFFSAKIGQLNDTILIDSNAYGGFCLDSLKSIPIDSYEGVIYTNIFANNSNWLDVQEFCKTHDKKLVIDNATGLFDRPMHSQDIDQPIEIISAHHTKPWGVGEGGFIICSPDQEVILRKLINFGVELNTNNRRQCSNYKISDISAAAIFVRLEQLSEWAPYYYQAEKQLITIMENFSDYAKPLIGNSQARSPRAHTPFVARQIVHLPTDDIDSTIITRKYYKPIEEHSIFLNSQALYDKIFCLPNCPALHFISDDKIERHIKNLLKSSLHKQK